MTCLLYTSNSGSVHVVDELCYDVIQALDTMGIDQAENPVEEMCIRDRD